MPRITSNSTGGTGNVGAAYDTAPQHVSGSTYVMNIPNGAGGNLEVKLALKSGAETTRKIGGAPVNCYAFARGRKRHIPGGTRGPVSLPYMVNPESTHKALLKDGGIALGLNPFSAAGREPIELDPDETYYLVAAMTAREEYHFARLFSDGWWAKPSKVKLAGQMGDIVDVPDTKTEFKGKLCKSGGRTAYNPLGYYLFPAPK